MRYLKPNHGCASPTDIIFYDTETVGDDPLDPHFMGENRFRLGVACYVRMENNKPTREEWIEFTDPATFFRFVGKHSVGRKTLWVFAHNQGFDSRIIGLYDRLAAGEFLMYTDQKKRGKDNWSGYFVDDDPPFILETRHAKTLNIVRWVDTLNYWLSSADKIGQSLGYPKLRMPKVTASDSKWFTYCKRDVEIIREMIVRLIQWIKDEDLGNFRLTRASLAMNAYRHRFLPKYLTLHEVPFARQLERDCYYGGRLEMFHKGRIERRIYALDVASMYPFLMRDGFFPSKLLDWSSRTGCYREPKTLNWRYCAEVEIRTDSEVFPFRASKAGTIYPRGTYWTCLCGPELQRAVDTGCIHGVRRWSLYRLDRLFKTFVEHFWPLRKAAIRRGDTTSSEFIKFVMCSLYGKWGQLRSDWETYGENNANPCWSQFDFEDYDTGETVEGRTVGNLLQKRVELGEHKMSFPAIAAWVTAYGRELVAEYIRVAGEGHIFYVVTDGVFVDRTGYRRLQQANLTGRKELGNLVLEGTSATGRFDALHHLKAGGKRKFGSRKAKAIAKRGNKVEELQFESIRGIWMRDTKNTVTVRKVTKHFVKEYRRGRRLKGGAITPLILPGDAEFGRVTIPEIAPRDEDTYHSFVEEPTE